MKSYAEKLKDPRWQRKRLEIMNRDGFACMQCKSDTKTLHVHHKEYRSGAEPWEYPDENFQTLCEDCHGKEHEVAIEATPKRPNPLLSLIIQLAAKNPDYRRNFYELAGTCVECPECEDQPIVRVIYIITSRNTHVDTLVADMPDELRGVFRHAMAAECGFPDEFDEEAVKQICSQFRGLILRHRDRAVKAALKQPDLSTADLLNLLSEAKDISQIIRDQGGQRLDFSDDLPKSTFGKQPTKHYFKR